MTYDGRSMDMSAPSGQRRRSRGCKSTEQSNHLESRSGTFHFSTNRGHHLDDENVHIKFSVEKTKKSLDMVVCSFGAGRHMDNISG
jgi:hypothetical protein